MEDKDSPESKEHMQNTTGDGKRQITKSPAKDAQSGRHLKPQRSQYPLPGHLIRHMSALLQRNSPNDSVHSMCENEFEARAGEVLGLHSY